MEDVKTADCWLPHNPRYPGPPVPAATWVQVRANMIEEPSPPRRAGEVYWGDREDCDEPVGWYRIVDAPAAAPAPLPGGLDGSSSLKDEDTQPGTANTVAYIRERLDSIIIFARDSLDNGHLYGGDVGNVLGIRDEAIRLGEALRSLERNAEKRS